MKKVVISLTFILLMSGYGVTQSSKSQIKSAVGVLVSSEGGNRQGIVCLMINVKTQCFEWGSTNMTKFRGFQNGKAWEIGAEWHITYTYDRKDNMTYLRSAAFKGRIKK